MSMPGVIFKPCGCRDGSRRRLEQACPRLGERGHGSWYFHCSATNLLGRPERVRRGGYPSQAAARRARDQWLGSAATGRTAAGWTVQRWLWHWLDTRTRIRPTTRFHYTRDVETVLIPHLGRYRLADLDAPLILLGHPGGLHRMYPRLVARARHCAEGFAAATIELPGSGDRSRSAAAEAARADLRRALEAGEPVGEIVDRLVLPLVDKAVPEWRAALDDLKHARAHCPDLDTLTELAHTFNRLVRERGGHQIEAWIKRATASSFPELRGFAAGLLNDFDAVRNGLTQHWSSGAVEGNVNRIKMIKRQMYGRAKLDLLRKRILGRDDAAALRQRLAEGPGHVLVIGAGFIGCEVASDCRKLGLPVTVVDRGPAPLSGALGAAVGRVAAQMQREAGVDLRCGVSVHALDGDADGRLRRARLSDGSTLDVDVAVAALGAKRNVEWLEGSGLAAGRWGVGCDAGCRAFDANGVVTDDIFVAGDVARFPHPVYDYQFMALEHWGNAVDQAEIATHNMVSAGPDLWPHVALPVFWSTQFGVEIKSIGVPTFADEVVVAQGSTAERRFVAAYGRQGRITAAVTFDHGMWLEFYGRLIEQAAPFPPRSRTVDQPSTGQPVPAEIRQAPPAQATVVLTGHQPSERRAVLVHAG